MIELLLIIALLLLVFGAKKLRTAGSDLGAAIKGFRRGLSGRAAAAPAPQVAAPEAAQAPAAEARPDGASCAEPQQPDAEFPEVLAESSRRGSGRPRA